jgi:hypothetical protein
MRFGVALCRADVHAVRARGARRTTRAFGKVTLAYRGTLIVVCECSVRAPRFPGTTAGMGRRSDGQRGFMLVEELVSAGLGVLVLALVLTALVALTRGYASVFADAAAITSLDAARSQWRNLAESSTALYVPANDPVDGSANADGHVCEFLTRDAQRHDHFTTIRYSATQQLVQLYTRDAIGAAPIAHGAPLLGIATFTATLLHAHDLHDPWMTKPFADQEWNMGYPGVVAGNVSLDIHVADLHGNRRHIGLESGTNPSSMNIVTALFTPRPDPIVVTPASVVMDLGDVTQVTATEGESKYYIGQYFVTRPTPCDPYVTVADPTNPQTKAPWPIALTAQAAGSCAFAVTDEVGNAPASVAVTVRGALVVDPTTIVFSGPHDANPIGTHPGGVTFTDPGGIIGVQQANATGTFTVTPDSACASIIGTQPILVAAPSGQFALTPIGIGSCGLTVSTQPSSVGPGPSARVQLTVNPPPLVVAPTSLAFKGFTAASQPFVASEDGYTGAFAIDDSACTANHLASADTHASSANPATITVGPDRTHTNQPLTCTIMVGDDTYHALGSPNAVAVAITVTNTEVCSQAHPPLAEGQSGTDASGASYVSDGTACSADDYLLAASSVPPASPPQSAVDQQLLAACAAAGTPFCTLSDGSVVCTSAASGSVGTCALSAYESEAGLANAALGNGAGGTCVDVGGGNWSCGGGTCTTNWPPGDTPACFYARGNGGVGTVVKYPTQTVVPSTLVRAHSPDGGTSWYDCYVNNGFSTGTPDAAATTVTQLDHSTWPPKAVAAALALQDRLPLATPAICPGWANY